MAKGSENDFPSVLFTEQAVKPASPATGKRRVYFKTDNKFYNVDEAGTETEIGAGGVARSGATTDNHLAVWDGSNADSIKDGGVPGAGGNVTEAVAVGSETATAEGDLNFATDGPVVERYDGAAWQTWGPIFKLTAPPAAGWAWINQGGATLGTAGGVLLLSAPAGANNSRLVKRAAPVGAYTVTALVCLSLPNANWFGGGLLWRQSSDGKLVYFGFQNDNSGAGGGGGLLCSWKCAGPTTALAASYAPNWSGSYEPFIQANSPFIWLRIADNTSSRICSISYDKLYWTTIHSVGRTDYMTADEIGFGLLVESNTLGCGMSVLSWEVT